MYEGQTTNMIEFVTVDGKHIHIMKDEFNRVLGYFRIWRKDLCGSNFSSELFRLMCKADFSNMQRFLTGFPTETIIYQLWYHSKSEEDFFKIWGNIKIGEEPLINKIKYAIEEKERNDLPIRFKEEWGN